MSIEEILNFTIPFTSITVFNIISAIVVIVIGYIAAIVFSKYLKRTMLKAKMAKILAEFTSRVAKILIIIFVFAIAIGFLGIDVGSAVISLSVVSGFVFGFAFQETLGNLAAGFMVAITKPFRVGDYVDVAGNAGSINHVGASITTMTTYDNRRIVIPNSKIWGNPIVNYTALNQRMIDMKVGISYGDDIGKAINVTMNVIKKHEKVISDPAPIVAVADLGDSSVDLLVRPWVQTSDYWTVRRDLTRQIKEAFDKEGISIPFPQTDVHLFQKK
jgi:small conductance mechanosensitive channel